MYNPFKQIPILMLFVVFAGISMPSLAQTTPASSATTPDQALQTPAGKFIQDLGDKAISIIADKSLTQAQRSSKYEGLLQDAFNLPAIGHFVLGRAWNTATPQQQDDFIKLFSRSVIKIYGERLSFYSGESFHVKGVRNESDKDYIVSSEIGHPGGAQPTTIDWRVRQDNGKTAILDVSVEGVSQSITQRDEYADILQRNNGNIDALLNLMRQRLQNPAPGQPSSSP